MNTRKSPFIVAVTLFVLLPVAIFLFLQTWAATMQQPLLGSDSDDMWDILLTVLRVMPIAMVLFSIPLADATNYTRPQKWFAALLTAGLNVCLYLVSWTHVSWLTSAGVSASIAILCTYNLMVIILWLSRK